MTAVHTASHLHVQRPAHQHRRMPRRQRFAVYGVSVALWASGLLWLLLDQFFGRQGQFGPTPHPLQAPLLLLHGVVALVAAYTLGWISARHVLRWWTAGERRISGGVLTSVVIVLSVSGFALFFVSDDAGQRVARLTHEALGLAVALFAIQHWAFAARSRT